MRGFVGGHTACGVDCLIHACQINVLCGWCVGRASHGVVVDVVPLTDVVVVVVVSLSGVVGVVVVPLDGGVVVAVVILTSIRSVS